ncbi:hypothetical protein HMPREF1210_00150 [Paenisporosarcina sp. HGH0030]|uniref:hypothetical protein n=1 Tax=Paenisporosarcina sp. HGH0030 TaxID=1078085 RepID=UPI00034E9EEE|nr:hypothetical protein [Paenisporosarcina sp. HGH0030]EPD54165.1 hypothetical protein HMPREF1210_00150 [Paenisporosarcina sp. HGH0030]
MTHLILQPSGGAGKKNFENTIKNPVPFSAFSKYLNVKETETISAYYKNGLVPIWGVTQGKKDINKNKWEKILVGDVAIFTAEMRIFASGIVTHKLHSSILAEELWGWKEDGVTWEYIYLLDEIKTLDIPVVEMNKIIGYSVNKAVMGFDVLNEKRSRLFFNAFKLESDIYNPSVSSEEYKESILYLDPLKPLDSEGKSKKRTEQSFLRKYLFNNNKYGTCGICSETLPVGFLVASHIKKRYLCSNEEKLDYQNIVMPMCKLGCDELYERGYIAILDGEISLTNKESTDTLNKYLNKVNGLKCSYWNINTMGYFDWHRKHHS